MTNLIEQASKLSLGSRHNPLSYAQFKLEAQIGTGSFGTVFRATHIPTKLQCAIKRIDLESSDDDIEEIQREIAILAECNNNFITRYFGCFMHEFELWIVMEYLGAGSCLDLIKELRPGTLPEPAVAEILSQVIEGLLYLHHTGKIHRDIKAANVLISDKGEVKIADFGVAAQLSNNLSRRNTFVGTPFWMAPEVIDELEYSFEADIWSLGVTAIELAYGKPPWSHLHPMKALFTIPRSDAPRLDSRFSSEFQDFVAQCLQMDPKARAPISQLGQHPFMVRRSRQGLVTLIHHRKTVEEPTDVSQIIAGIHPHASIAEDGSKTIDTLSFNHFQSSNTTSPDVQTATINKSSARKNRVESHTNSRRRMKPKDYSRASTDGGRQNSKSLSKSTAPSRSIQVQQKDIQESVPASGISMISSVESEGTLNEFSALNVSAGDGNTSYSTTMHPIGDSERLEPEGSDYTLGREEVRTEDEDPADDWDFDTIRPQPSLEQILQNPPPSIAASPQVVKHGSERNSSANRGLLPQSDERATSTATSASQTGTVDHDTISSSNTISQPQSLVRIFEHAARKFRDPNLDEISDLLRADPPTVDVESYLVKRISRLTTQTPAVNSIKEQPRDAIEQLLLDKWLGEVAESQGQHK